MVGLPFFDEDTTPAIRVPAIQIDIGGGGDSGGFGGIADAASSLLGGPAAPSWADHLVSLTLQQGFAPSVDHLELLIANTEGAPTAAVDDEGSVSIGPSDNLEKLFTGRVVAVEKRSDGLRRYHLSNGSHTLAQGRLNRSVTDMSAKDAIDNLGGEFGYSPNASISGNDAVLSQIVFDDSGSVWEHCAHLAKLRGANLWLDADDTLQLADQLEQGDSVASFTWDAIRNDEIQALAKKVAVREDPAMTAKMPDLRPAAVKVTLTDGTALTATTDTNKGDWQDPYTEPELAEKFMALTTRRWTPAGAQAVHDEIMTLRNAPSLAHLTTLIDSAGDAKEAVA